MGCGASTAPAKCTDVQMAEMYNFAVKETMIQIGSHAISKAKTDGIVVTCPTDERNKVCAFIAKLTTTSQQVSEKMGKGAEDAVGGAMDKLGGIGGGAMGALAAGLKTGAGAVGSAVGGGLGAALSLLATNLQASLDKMDGDFQDVGNSVLSAKEQEIITVYKQVVNDSSTSPGIELIHGDPTKEGFPGSAAEDAVSAHITANARENLVAAMLKVTQEFVQTTKGVKSWKAFAELYNKSVEEYNKKVGEIAKAMGKSEADADKPEQGNMSADVEQHIVGEIVDGFSKLMAAKEKEIRTTPTSVVAPKHAQTFQNCWNRDLAGKLIVVHYKAFKGE